MNLTPELVEAYQKLIVNPKEHGLPFRPILDCFEVSETVTAKHKLAEEYLRYLKKDLPKLVLYIIMDHLYGQCVHKDSNGDLGYYLVFKRIKNE